jgi:hypothetical protein
VKRPSTEALIRWLSSQRWFDRTDDAGTVTLTDAVPLPGRPSAGLVLARTTRGDRYQLVVADTTSW